MIQFLKRKYTVVRMDKDHDILVLRAGYSTTNDMVQRVQLNIAERIARVTNGFGFQVFTIPQGMEIAGVIHVDGVKRDARE